MRYLLASVLLGASVICGCSSQTDSSQPAAADLLLYNARAYTMDDQRRRVEAVAVRDGRIVYAGDTAGAAEFAGAGTRRVDLQGRVLLPAFQDVHIHPVHGGLGFTECPLFDTQTVDQVLDKVRQCVKDKPDAEFIRGNGWNWGIFLVGSGPDKAMLDAIDDTRPVLIGDADGHTLWVNSKALELAGITADTENPEGGEIRRHPETGEPTGALLEGPAMELLNAALPPLTMGQQLEALRYAQDYLHSMGITAIQDAIVRLDGGGMYESLPAYQRLRDSGELKLRVSAALLWDAERGSGQVAAMQAARDTYSGGRLRVNTVKFWADGILEGHTAFLLEPYSDRPDTRGMLMVPLEQLQAGIAAADAAGFQVHVHTIGDATLRHALDALAAARTANGRRDARHLTAHTQLVHPDDLGRFAELDVIAGFSPYWAYNEEYVAEINPPQLGAERMAGMYPIGRIARSGARIAFGSDWSVSSADPLLGIETAVTRLSPHDGELVPVFNPQDRITVEAAVTGYTINAAYANFLDTDTGSIEVGKYADLVVLRGDPFEVAPQDISAAAVVATLMEGELVYGAL